MLRPSPDTPDAPLVGAAPWPFILSGAAWGPWYFGMNWVGWGEPGSPAFSRYETYNRMAPAVLLLLLTATQYARRLLRDAIGLRGSAWSHLASVGLSVMAVGSALEFRAFTGSPYSPGTLRGYGWTTYCLGLLLFYVGMAALGLTLRRVPGFAVAGFLRALRGWVRPHRLRVMDCVTSRDGGYRQRRRTNDPAASYQRHAPEP